MRTLFIFFYLVPFVLLAQRPLELERYPAEKYGLKLAALHKDSDPIIGYLYAYFEERCLNSDSYFPEARQYRIQYREKVNNGKAKADKDLVNFIETKGSNAAALELLGAGTERIYLLPYQFLAAFITGNEVLEKQYLIAMEQEEILSPVTKKFGMELARSAAESKWCIAGGLQDLIAIRWAQLVKGIAPELTVTSPMLDEFAGWKGPRMSEMLKSKTRGFFSPVCRKALLTKHSAGLYLTGLGYTWLPKPDADYARERLQRNSEWIAEFDILPYTPADHGLIASYHPLALALSELALAEGDDALGKKASDLIKTIELSRIL